MDKPSCPSCGSLTFAIGVVPPTPEEMAWGAGNVESYKCVYCGKVTRFPRYNHPAKLLGENVRQHLFSQQFIFIEQIDSLLSYVCTAIDHRWRQNAVQKKKKACKAQPSVSLKFLSLTLCFYSFICRNTQRPMR